MGKQYNESYNKKSIGERFSRFFKVFMTVIMILYVLSLLIPIYWMVINSFKENLEYFDTVTITLPKNVGSGFKENYFFIFDKLKVTRVVPGKGRVVFTVWEMLKNSIILAVLAPVFSNLVFMTCGYVLARYKFPGSKFLYTLGIFVMIMPVFGGGTSTMLLRKATGTYDNMLLMIVTGVRCGFSGITFLMFYAAFKGIPKEYAEAVFLDGGGHLTVYVRIMIPMAFSTFGVLSLLGFLSQWADYELFLVWLPSYANLAFGLYLMQNDLRVELGVTVPKLLAAFVIVSIPTAALYISIQKFFINSFQVGGLKG